jgi:hypothetical protein
VEDVNVSGMTTFGLLALNRRSMVADVQAKSRCRYRFRVRIAETRARGPEPTGKDPLSCRFGGSAAQCRNPE